MEFRSRIEQIRQMGGDSWLKNLDEIQAEDELPQVLYFVQRFVCIVMVFFLLLFVRENV